ncbi:MAG TPA: SIMPL domain-containing protein [Verrucomicrobiae bacterium]|nr:SIMPL domain-containing protein [Verrucomicrobiae bacterium]
MRRILWLLILPLALWAQLDDNTVTVTASRTLPALQPDQAVFTVYVITPATATLDDAVAAVAGTGITAANLSGIVNLGVPPPPGSTSANPSTEWFFALTVPLASLGSTVSSLQTAGAGALQVNYSVSAQVSPQLQATQQCAYTALVGDARAQAQSLAMTAGAALGPILSVSDGSSIGVQTIAYLSGVFSQSYVAAPASRLGNFLAGPLPTPGTCTMVVQFSLAP